MRVTVEYRGPAVPRHIGIVVTHRTDEYADPLTGESFRIDTGTFDEVPGKFQSHSLPWIHGRGFPRRNTEEIGVEFLDIPEKSPR